MDKYKSFQIRFEEREDKFVAYDKDGEEVRADQSLRNLKTWLDDSLKKEFKCIPIYLYSDEKIRTGTITSFNSQNKEAWLVRDDKSREKLDWRWEHNVYAQTKENLKVLEKLVEIHKQMHKLETEEEKTKEFLSSISYKDMCKITGEVEVD